MCLLWTISNWTSNKTLRLHASSVPLLLIFMHSCCFASLLMNFSVHQISSTVLESNAINFGIGCPLCTWNHSLHLSSINLNLSLSILRFNICLYNKSVNLFNWHSKQRKQSTEWPNICKSYSTNCNVTELFFLVGANWLLTKCWITIGPRNSHSNVKFGAAAIILGYVGLVLF